MTCSTTSVRSNFKTTYHVFGQQEAVFKERHFTILDPIHNRVIFQLSLEFVHSFLSSMFACNPTGCPYAARYRGIGSFLSQEKSTGEIEPREAASVSFLH